MVLCSAPQSDKRLLVPTVAHELRKPVMSLRLSLEMLVGDYGGECIQAGRVRVTDHGPGISQGGRVGVESALDAGATFWFTLPAIDARLDRSPSDADLDLACRP